MPKNKGRKNGIKRYDKRKSRKNKGKNNGIKR
jgi:hypothetical protein